MRAFLSETHKIRWLNRQSAFRDAMPIWNKYEKAIALCVFDADMSGISMWQQDFIRMAGITWVAFSQKVAVMENKALAYAKKRNKNLRSR